MAPYSDVAGVRIIPPVVEFMDTEANGLYRIHLTVKNISKTSKSIRYYGPQNSKVFKLKVQNQEKSIACGLEAPAIIEYRPPENKVFSDRIMITVDEAVIEVPIQGTPSQPDLILQGPVNFGNVVANSKVISRSIQLVNHGSKAGEFRIKYFGDKPINIVPASGIVGPRSAIAITIEYVTKVPAKFDEVARVKLEGQSITALQIKGRVVEGTLELLSADTEEPVQCVKFGTTYYGTDCTESAILFNNGPDPACFVAVLDEDAIGQEVGVDLTKSTDATLAAQEQGPGAWSGQINEITSLVTAFPNQGTLAPYEKIPIYFRFSPRWHAPSHGFKSALESAPRKDYVLFIQLQLVGASDGFQKSAEDTKGSSNVKGVSLEVALAGTAVPVLLAVYPRSALHFGECLVREHLHLVCQLQNVSDCLPAAFQVRRIAHFAADPPRGSIPPGESRDIVFSFSPKQAGTFKPLQYVDVVGQVADNNNPFLMHQQFIHSLPIQFIGKGNPILGIREPVFNTGLTPQITNEVGMFVDAHFSAADSGPAMALVTSVSTKLHRNKSSKNRDNETQALIAFPNDRAGSLRPGNRNDKYKTIFTRVDRHTYVDPDYAYTDEEIKANEANRDYYLNFINYLRQKRITREKTREFMETDNDMDIAMKPAAGLRPKKLTIEEIEPDPMPPTPPNSNFQLLRTKNLAQAEKAASEKVKDGLNAVPTSAKEKADCSRSLTPQEIHQIVVGPPTIDFGKVCLRSVSQRELNIINNLDYFVHIVVHVDCRELRQTSPLSQVVPPHSKASLPLIFESGTKGQFQRSLDFMLNGFYKNHITVFAEVVPVALQLSTNELFLGPILGLPAEAGLRGVITLKNMLNLAAEFVWTPILGERGTAFSIRPATGMVEAHKDLDCEVVFHPSFLAPEDGFFALNVHGGNTLQLKCTAKLGPTNVQFIDRRVMFGQVPLHLTTTRVAMLRNNSINHSFFQVLEPSPFPGLDVTPHHGVIPVGGTAELRVQLTPNAIIKFDTHVQVAIRSGRTLELRMGGTVEPPAIEIDVETFDLGGVYCGSRATSVFKLVNQTNTKARMEFDLSRYADFTLSFPGSQTAEDYTFQLTNPGMFSVTIDGHETVSGELEFHPREVASYDFVVPVTINQTRAPSPTQSPLPPTPAPARQASRVRQGSPQAGAACTPRRKVVATALRQPLQLSHTRIEFLISPQEHEMAASGIGHAKSTLLVNNSNHSLKWAVNIEQGNKVLEQGVFKFLRASGMPFLTQGNTGVEGTLEPGQTQSLGVLFCPDKPGHFEVTVPLVLDKEWDKAYQYLTLVGKLKSPKLWFCPLALVLTPVPLSTDISAEFDIMAANYTKATSLQVDVPEVESDDGTMLSPLTVSFTGPTEIQPCSSDDDDHFTLQCRVTFKSSHPISFSQPIHFLDTYDNVFSLMVTATADNCLLTCYPFLALHRTDHQIICEQGTTLKGRKTVSRESLNVGEAVLVPCGSPPRPSSRPSTTATSSNFEISTSSYDDSTQSPTVSPYLSTPREGALNKLPPDSDGPSRGQNRMASRGLGSAMFPDEDSEEGIFHTEVLLAVQRWFSSQGWPGGSHPTIIPDSLRHGISSKPIEEKTRNAKGGTWDANNLKKEFKTVYDMISHLSGKQVPGIPINNSLPSDITERAKQVYWQHSTLLTFLKTQGGCVASIKPEYLMAPAEYKRWVRLQKELEQERHRAGHRELKDTTEQEVGIEDQLFEAVSKRAWTDVLLQLIKTLVLARITPRQFKQVATPHRAMPAVDPDPLCSNVYGLGERILLLWLNHNYEQQRAAAWSTCTTGGVPPSRWIVNFDFDLLDGLVLGAIISAHAPFLITTHLHDMYTTPSTAEQCLHNALKVVSALRVLSIDYDIQAIDITDPNPISLMLLCVHLYNNLPHYLPKSCVEFVGGLHTVVLRQVRLSNPSNKPLSYQAMLAGHDGKDFYLPKGMSIIIPPKSTHNLSIEFISRFLRPAEATLVLVGRRQGSNVGSTLVFNLRTQVDNISPKTTIRFTSPCYELNKIPVEVTNPFPHAGIFKIVLVENSGEFPGQNSKSTVPKPPKKTLQKVKSRTNHGQNRPEKMQKGPESEVLQLSETEEDDTNAMSAFHCTHKTVTLQAAGSETIHVDFLPFQTDKRQCSLIFINEVVGEFLYSIEATATLPLPTFLPFKSGNQGVRISSAAAAGGGRGMFGGDDSIVYWKCSCGQQLSETIPIPFSNPARENALLTASRQYMTREELRRRLVTGTLNSSTLTARTVGLLLARPGLTNTVPKKSCEDTVFKVKLDSQYFSAPDTVMMPNLYRTRSSSTALRNTGSADAQGVALPVSFQANESGHYSCRVILWSQDDVRVYRIECTVIPEGSDAQIEFASPVQQAVSQNIPIVNATNHDWPMTATITGEGFAGPDSMIAKAYQTTDYPLTFKPKTEGPVSGELVMVNTVDNVQHKFQLLGHGDQPLPLEQLIYHCAAKQTLYKKVHVPNITSNKLHYKVESDLDFVSGRSMMTVLPGKSADYELTMTPLRRGAYKGVVSFIATSTFVNEVDSDGDEVRDVPESVESMDGYRVWYSIEVLVDPPPPERTITVTCNCQKKVLLEVGLNNPTNQTLELTVDIVPNNQGVSGPARVTLLPQVRGVCRLEYAPIAIGEFKASLQFFNPLVGEFWYELELVAEKPLPTLMPALECELGRWVRQYLQLDNTTNDVLRLVPVVSNTNNFLLERDSEQPLELGAQCSLKVPVTFMPSALGEGDHQANITFHSEQLGEWVYLLSGKGRLPQPQDPVSITAMAGSNATLIIPFRNPLDIPVIADILLQDKEPLGGLGESPFCLLLKHATALRLGPKTSVDIPVSFAPHDIRRFDAFINVTIRQEDGQSWDYNLREESQEVPGPRADNLLSVIRWQYLVQGYAEQNAPDMQPALVRCQARARVEERLEVTLSGVAPATGGPKRGIRTRAVTPHVSAGDVGPRGPPPTDQVVVAEALVAADEFTYEVLYETAEVARVLEPTVALSLVRTSRCKETGLVMLLFNIIYAPYKTMLHDCELLVKGATGGIWKFPIRFIATEPVPDDTINIRAVGLNKEVTVGFRLTSMTSHPLTYSAYFVAGSDAEFIVTPASGELLSTGTKGTLIQVTFTPNKYGKVYQAKLVVQTPDMQWTYTVRGTPPGYDPPSGVSSRLMLGPSRELRQRSRRANYVRDNLRLTTTAVSSPMKGLPLIRRKADTQCT